VIINEFYETFRSAEDYSSGISANLNFVNGSIDIAEVALDPLAILGTWEKTITTEMTNSNKNRFFWNSETGTNNSVRCYLIQNDVEVELVNGEGVIGLPNDMFTIKVVLNRITVEDDSPVLHDFNVAVWEEISNTDLELAVLPQNITQDLLKLYSLEGELIAFLENASGIVTEEVLSAQQLLSFSMPYTDLKTQMINYDGEVVYKNKRYAITDIQDGIDDSGKYIFDVSCELIYIELLNKTIIGEFIVDLKTIREGAEMILNGTGWTVGQIEVDEKKTYSMLDQKKTSLWYIYTWATITGTDVEWNSLTREVNFKSRDRVFNKTFFRYGHNLKSIKRKIVPPQATVVYPYGKNGLSIGGLNNGIEFLEDYSWYVEQGISLATARQFYKKELTFEDDRFLMMTSLREEGLKLLKELSRPQISYECKVQDLSNVTGVRGTSFSVGDIVKVFNDDLKINVETRIVKLKRFHQEEWKNEIELGILQEGLEHSQSNAGVREAVQGAQTSVIFATNELAGVTVRLQSDILLRLRYSSFGSPHGQIGLSLVGEATHDALLTIRFLLADKPVSQVIKHQVKAGWNTIGVPLLFTEIAEGTNDILVETSVSQGTINVPQKYLQMFMFANNLLGGGIGEESAPAPKIIQRIDADRNIENLIIPEATPQISQTMTTNPRVPIHRRTIVQYRDTNIPNRLVGNGIIEDSVTVTLTRI
jgi:phage minor structural protein